MKQAGVSKMTRIELLTYNSDIPESEIKEKAKDEPIKNPDKSGLKIILLYELHLFEGCWYSAFLLRHREK